MCLRSARWLLRHSGRRFWLRRRIADLASRRHALRHEGLARRALRLLIAGVELAGRLLLFGGPTRQPMRKQHQQDEAVAVTPVHSHGL
jgi:hypothetical protein